MYTLAPFSAKAVAVTSPKPVPPPVTTARVRMKFQLYPPNMMDKQLTNRNPTFHVEKFGHFKTALANRFEKSSGRHLCMDNENCFDSEYVEAKIDSLFPVEIVSQLNICRNLFISNPTVLLTKAASWSPLGSEVSFWMFR